MTKQEELRLEITFQAADSLTEELDREINAVDHLAFSVYGEDEDGGIQWALSSTWFVLGWLDGRLVSLIGVLDRAIQVGEQSFFIGGVGGVATHPEFQRRGFAALLLQAAAEEMSRRGSYDFAMLFCDTSMIPYYTKNGYCLVQNPLYILQSDRRVLFEDNKMVLPISGMPWPDGDVDVNGPPW